MTTETFTQVAYGHAAIITRTLHEALAAANGNSDQFAESWELVEELNQAYNNLIIESFYSETEDDYILSIHPADHVYIPESRYKDFMPVTLTKPELAQETIDDFLQLENLLSLSATERNWFFMQIVS